MHPLNRAFSIEKFKKSLIFPLLEVLEHGVKLLKDIYPIALYI